MILVLFLSISGPSCDDHSSWRLRLYFFLRLVHFASIVNEVRRISICIVSVLDVPCGE